MRLIRARVDNILSHKSTVYDFPNDATLFFLGKNGSGKTSFIESILPGLLYGEMPSRGNLYSNIRLGNEKEPSLIELEFEYEGNIYRAVKNIDGKNKKVDAFIYKNNEVSPVAGPKVTDFSSYVEALLGSKNIFLSSCFTSQLNSSDITDCSPTERIELLNEIWNTEYIQAFSEKANSKIKTETIELVKIETQLSSTQTKIDSEEQYLTELSSANITKLETENAILQINNSILEVKDQKTKYDQYLENQKELKIVEQKIKDTYTKIEKLDNTLATTASNVLKEPELIKEKESLLGCEEKLAELEAIQKNKSAEEAELKVLTSTQLNSMYLIDSLQKQLVEVNCSDLSCPYFVQMDSIKTKLLTEQETDKNRSKLIEQKKATINNITTVSDLDILTQRNSIKRLNNILLELSKLDGDKKIVDSLTEQKPQLQEVYDSLIQKKENLTTVKLIDAEQLAKVANLSVLETSLVAKTGIKDQIVARIGYIQETLKEIEDAKLLFTTLTESKNSSMLSIAEFEIISKAFSKTGIQSLLINKYKSELEKIIEDLLSSLEDNKIKISFSTKKELASGKVKESLEILVSDEMGTRDIRFFSGGEIKLIKIIIRMALSIYQALRNKNKLSVFVVDEMFDALDDDKSVMLVQIINKLRNYFNQIVIITHNAALSSYFTNKVEFYKEGYTKLK